MALSDDVLAKAYTRCGIWKAGEKCGVIQYRLDRWNEDGRRIAMGREWTCNCGHLHKRLAPFLHTIPMPPLTWKLAGRMIEWLHEHGNARYFGLIHADGRPFAPWITDYTVEPLTGYMADPKEAIALAVANLPEEK